VQAYNVQVAVDELQLIVGQAVTQETNDKHQLLPMITTIEQQSGDTPTQLLADADARCGCITRVESPVWTAPPMDGDAMGRRHSGRAARGQLMITITRSGS
jgi:hypothetical protein